jgi:glycosyltransferase involved in cell wall biosynthesis
VRRLLRAEEPVLLHTHMAKAGSIGRMAALSSRSRPVLVHTFHGHVLEGYFRPSLREVFLRTERFLARRTDALIAVSVEIRDQLLELGIGSPDRWRVVPLGFDLEQMLEVDGRSGVLRERFGLADEPLVGVIGRLAPIKDHATLIHAVARLRGVHLAVLGDGELRGELEDLVATLRIADRVHFVGWLLDVPSAIADMDAVALTSRNEGTPVSLIEAHACGRPVVATDVGGVRSVVIDGSTGFLVPPKDATAVATCLEQVLSDRDLAKRMGAAGRDHVRDRFTQERLVSVIRSLYEELLR